MVRLLILRHGYSVTNKEKRFTGQRDVPLDAVGHKQAEAACRYLVENYKIDAIYSSDLCRAADTVAPLAERLSLPIRKDARLREFAMGDWEGKKFAEIDALYPETRARQKIDPWRMRYEGGESCDEVMARVSECILSIARENEGKTVLVASHGGAIRQLMRFVLGLSYEEHEKAPLITNASLSLIEYEDGALRLRFSGKTEHLAEFAEVNSF